MKKKKVLLAVVLTLIGLAVVFCILSTRASVRLTNMYGKTLESAYVDGMWQLSSDSDVLVWVDLPSMPWGDAFKGKFEATYPYEIKAGEIGTIEIKVKSKYGLFYSEKLNFRATDDLVLESGVEHTRHLNSGRFSMNFVEKYGESEHAYAHFSLYTSAKNRPRITKGQIWTSGIDTIYHIKAVGDFDESEYCDDHCIYCGNDRSRKACLGCGGESYEPLDIVPFEKFHSEPNGADPYMEPIQNGKDGHKGGGGAAESSKNLDSSITPSAIGEPFSPISSDIMGDSIGQEYDEENVISVNGPIEDLGAEELIMVRQLLEMIGVQ